MSSNPNWGTSVSIQSACIQLALYSIYPATMNIAPNESNYFVQTSNCDNTFD